MLTTEITGRPGNRYRVPNYSIPENGERLRKLAESNGQNAVDIVQHALDGWEWAVEMLEGVALDPTDVSLEQAALIDRRTIREGRELAELFAARNKRIVGTTEQPEETTEIHHQNTTTTTKRKLVFDKYPTTSIVRWLFEEGATKSTMVEIFKQLDVSVADATYSCQISAMKRGAAEAPTLDKQHALKLLQMIDDIQEDEAL